MWSATKPKSSRKDVVFPDKEDSIWELHPKTNEWYLHHFYKHHPDLNIANPKVQEEISRTLGFWLALGVSGFRIDAVPFLFARDGVPGDPGVFDPYEYLGDVRNFVTRRVGDAVLLGEVNVGYKDQKTFFGGPDGDGLNMQFDFIGMQNLFLSLARGDARPIAKALRQRPGLDVTSQWANFVRNHDELTLDKLTDEERQEVFDAFGPDPDMQLYGRGLRRRLPSMLGGQPNRAVLAHVCREQQTGWQMFALHNFGADGCLLPIELEDVPPGAKLVDLLDGLSEHTLDDSGRTELTLDGYGYRWLRLLRPGDDPII